MEQSVEKENNKLLSFKESQQALKEFLEKGRRLETVDNKATAKGFMNRFTARKTG